MQSRMRMAYFMSDSVSDENYLLYVGHYANNDKETKIGKTTNLYNRCCQYNTSRAFCDFIFKFIIEVYDKENYDLLEHLLLEHFEKYAANKQPGYKKRNDDNEWIYKFVTKQDIENALKTITEDVVLMEYTLYSDEEVTKLEKNIRNKDNENQQQNKIKLRQRIKELKNKRNGVVEYQWNGRQYQTTIINKSIEELGNKGRLYIKLPTGAGKSYVFYKIANRISPKIIVAFSSRKNINKQNVQEKYLSILQKNYAVYDCSTQDDYESFSRKHEYHIIAACTNSHAKVHNMIKNVTLNDLMIWFDEAHYGVEKWIEHKEESICFLLKDKRIPHRIFTSASPDKQVVDLNQDVFGKLYSYVKVSELISLGWLCGITPYVFGTDTKSSNLNEYNLDHFTQYNASFGFSFHNNRDNAFELFQKHYNSYKDKLTQIKPFLLVGNDYKGIGLGDIELDYDFRSVERFKEENNSIAYICDLYKMGFDFDKLDYLIFSDPKFSWQEIIQCIGRGTRSDKMDDEGKNLSKTLKVMLPVFVDENNETKFDKIVNVLQYLVYDVDIPPESINMNFGTGSGEKAKANNTEYGGDDKTSAVILDLVARKPMKLEDFIAILKENDIHTREDYNEFCDREPYRNLPQHPGIREFKDFTWEQTYETSPYYSEEECRKKIVAIMYSNDELELDEMCDPGEHLHKEDNKIPPIDYKGFYGTDPPY